MKENMPVKGNKGQCDEVGKPNGEDFPRGNNGYCNSGEHNSGNCNSGNHNSGDSNLGSENSSNHNFGDENSGDYNNGSSNSGSFNIGDCNSGCWNIGNSNSGYYNRGSYNTGNNNRGNRNSGDWNKCNFASGCFNTIEPKIYLFNRLSDWSYSDWNRSTARKILSEMPEGKLEYVNLWNMTEAEKAAHPEAKVTDGYLREEDMRSVRAYWWRSLSKEEKAIIMAIPNFDPEIFLEITGIDVGANP